MAALRAASAADLPEVIALLKDCGLPYQDLTAEHLGRFLVVRDSDAIAGVVGLEHYREDALLRSLAVCAEGRRTGLGVQLVAAAEAQALRSGIANLYLLTTTAADFFARRGYAMHERSAAPPALQASAEFSSLCPSQAVCMRKTLN